MIIPAIVVINIYTRKITAVSIDKTSVVDDQRIEIAVPALFGAERYVDVEGCQLLPLDDGDHGFYLFVILYPRADLHPAVQINGVGAYGLDRLADILRAKSAG